MWNFIDRSNQLLPNKVLENGAAEITLFVVVIKLTQFSFCQALFHGFVNTAPILYGMRYNTVWYNTYCM